MASQSMWCPQIDYFIIHKLLTTTCTLAYFLSLVQQISNPSIYSVFYGFMYRMASEQETVWAVPAWKIKSWTMGKDSVSMANNHKSLNSKCGMEHVSYVL